MERLERMPNRLKPVAPVRHPPAHEANRNTRPQRPPHGKNEISRQPEDRKREPENLSLHRFESTPGAPVPYAATRVRRNAINPTNPVSSRTQVPGSGAADGGGFIGGVPGGGGSTSSVSVTPTSPPLSA